MILYFKKSTSTPLKTHSPPPALGAFPSLASGRRCLQTQSQNQTRVRGSQECGEQAGPHSPASHTGDTHHRLCAHVHAGLPTVISRGGTVSRYSFLIPKPGFSPPHPIPSATPRLQEDHFGGCKPEATSKLEALQGTVTPTGAPMRLL